MNFLKKVIGITVMLIMFIMSISCKKEDNVTNNIITFNKDFLRVQLYDNNIPDDYKLIDWKQKARQFDELVFNTEEVGKFLPLIWNDETYGSFGIPAYVGDGRMNKDGAQEAVTNVASILSASLMGIDKTLDKNYVNELNAFFNEDEGIFLNNPAGSSETTSMWYLLYPAIITAHVSYIYEDELQLRENVLKTINSWYKAYEVMYKNGQSDFDYTGYNFNTDLPYQNGIWKEPDSAVGIALLMFYGYELTNDDKFLNATINCLDYIENYFGSPQYEALMYFAPFLQAKFNALHNTDYDITKSLNRVFDGVSIPRGGWGSIVGKWGDYDMNGLFGSTTDGGGYAFAMNTFASTSAIVPLVQYDARYARSIGEWMLHLSSNARYFFADETNKANQSCEYVQSCQGISPLIKQAVPYEGIRKESQGKNPWFGGDPTVYGWAQTDFSLYSGAHIGLLASIIEETNVEKILRLDLLKTQFFNKNNFPTFLLYNPYIETKTVDYKIHSEGKVDLFNTVTNTIIKQNVSRITQLDIPADDAIVIVELPVGSSITYENHNYYVDNKFISRDQVTLNITGLEQNDTVSGKFTIDINLVGNYQSSIDEIIVEIEDKKLQFNDVNKISLNTKDYHAGTRKIIITVKTKDGLEDHDSIRLRFEK